MPRCSCLLTSARYQLVCQLLPTPSDKFQVLAPYIAHSSYDCRLVVSVSNPVTHRRSPRGQVVTCNSGWSPCSVAALVPQLCGLSRSIWIWSG